MMRATFAIVVVTIMMMSCHETKTMSSPSPVLQAQRLSKLDLKSLDLSSTVSKLKVSLLSENSTAVLAATDIQPSTTYQIVIEGVGPTSYVVRNSEGFAVLSKKSSVNRTTFLIKTDDALIGRLFISVAPIVNEQNTLRRQNAQSFLLPSN